MSAYQNRQAGLRRALAILGILGALPNGSCSRSGTPERASAKMGVTSYVPRARNITITTVPLLVKEEQSVLPFLKEDFARGGVLDGKEVYAFSPSTVTVFEGDTIHFTFINPEDDLHSFVLPDFAVSLPGQKTTTATYVAKGPGIYTFECAIASHLPMMYGQLVVLAAMSTSSRVSKP